jgi:hypothetical protein
LKPAVFCAALLANFCSAYVAAFHLPADGWRVRTKPERRAPSAQVLLQRVESSYTETSNREPVCGPVD